ncbi:MAG: SRPBCC domain-containing protein [Chloroflexi bacterium]|nr:SRPBCC domain-containing protein [Chloroflexota bacterium]
MAAIHARVSEGVLLELDYERPVAAPGETVWAALTDPEAMSPHLPAATTVVKTGPDKIRVSMKIKMGFLRPTVSVDVQLSDVATNHSFRSTAAGKSMGAGLEGSARVTISDAGTATFVRMAGTVETTGLLKKVPDSKINTAVSGFLDDYFASVERHHR